MLGRLPNFLVNSLGDKVDELNSMTKTRKLKIKTQIFVAAENIRFAWAVKGSMLRRLTSNAMTALGNENQIKLFQQVGLCYSWQSEQKNNLKRSEIVRKTVFQSLNMSKHCYGILLFDNLGFKNRQGWRKGLGYEQFIVLKVVLIDEDKLKKT